MEFIKKTLLVWRNCLVVSGVLNNQFCSYNKQNLDYAGSLFIAFLINEFKNIVHYQIGPLSDSIQILIKIVKTRLYKLLTRQRDLITKLTTLHLQDENGKDVRKFNFKISDLCKEIEQTGKTPQDLALLVTKIYINSQVESFFYKILNIQFVLNTDPDKYTWTEIANIVYQYWFAIDSVWAPAGKTLNGFTKQEFDSLKQNFDTLKL